MDIRSLAWRYGEPDHQMKPTYLIIFLLFLSCSSKNESLQADIANLEQQIKLLKIQADSSELISNQNNSIIDSLANQLKNIYSSDTSCLRDPNLQKIEIINHIFYHEVIRGRSVPRVKKENGIAKMRLDEFLNGLKKKEIFDSVFINFQKERFWQCKVDIDAMTFEGDMDLGWDPESCDFFNYYYYIGGQEPPQYYQTTDFINSLTTATAKIRYFDVYKKQEHIWPQYLNMTYVSIDGEWRIQTAELSRR